MKPATSIQPSQDKLTAPHDMARKQPHDIVNKIKYYLLL
jgi:hypothetical protein